MIEFKPVKTAIVGCGMISNIYIKNLKNLFSITDLVALCDVIPELAEQKAQLYGIEKVMTFDEILADSEIELVVNLTGPAAHYDVIKRALEGGKHVFTEKLLCFDFEQGKELVKIANQKGLYLGVAPDTFLGAGLQTARKILDSGLIGEVTSAVACINRNQALNSEFFGYIRFTGGAFPYDVGVYYLTALLSLLGPVKRVAGFGRKAATHAGRMIWAGNYGKEWDLVGNNLISASLQFESGVLGSVHFNGNSINDEQPHLVIYGTEGILHLGDPNTFNGEVTLVRNGEGRATIPFTHGFKGTPVYDGETSGSDTGGHRGVGAAELCWSLRAGRQPRASKELGLHTMEILCGLDIASEENIVYEMTTSFERPRALPTGYLATEFGGMMRTDGEMALTL